MIEGQIAGNLGQSDRENFREFLAQMCIKVAASHPESKLNPRNLLVHSIGTAIVLEAAMKGVAARNENPMAWLASLRLEDMMREFSGAAIPPAGPRIWTPGS